MQVSRSKNSRLLSVSGTAPVMHFQLQLARQKQSVVVAESPEALNAESMTPATLIDRQEISETPGAALTNSLNMITDYVPGAYMTHDQLHVRGGHQVTWAIDGVPIPNTNIASNVGSPIDPKDIDTLEVDRGGYSAEYGDRTYGIFNVVPRTGFETDRQIEINTTYGTFNQTNDQINFGDHTGRFAYFGSINGNRSDYGLETPGPQILHDRVSGLGGFASLIFNLDPANQFRFVVSSRGDDYQIPNTPEQNAGAFVTSSVSGMYSPPQPGSIPSRPDCFSRSRLSCTSIAPITMVIQTIRRSARPSTSIRLTPERKSCSTR